MHESALPVVLFGCVEPVVAAGLSTALRGLLTVATSPLTPPALLSEARRIGAVAVIARRADVAEIAGTLPSDLLVLGVSAASFDLLICSGRSLNHMTNPHPEAVVELIRSVA
jgi:hypothetical protein